MTPRTKWVTIPLSFTAATAILSAGIAIGHALEVQAQFVTRAEYTENRNDVQTRFLKDSLTLVILKSEMLTRLDQQAVEQQRTNRILYRVACKLYPSECDR